MLEGAMLKLACIVCLMAVSAQGTVLLPTFIASNMVLQREPLKARLWGTAADTESLTISINGQTDTHAQSKGGKWSVDLPAMPASSSNTITISSSTGQKIELVNIAFGDVFLCSGQSNMQFSVGDAFNASAEIAASGMYPDLRLATVARVTANSPQFNVTSKPGSARPVWASSSPAAINPKGGFSWPSAACYFFGRSLYMQKGGKVPIGLVGSDWGGQKVEAFSSPDALSDKTCGGTVQPQAAIEAAVQGVGAYDTFNLPADQPNPAPMQLWYAMIYPLLPMRFKAALWYQGEANAGDPPSYCCRFPAMIADWRKKFGLDLPFFFVQLAPPNSQLGTGYGPIREAQMCALKLPNTGYAIAVDLGDPTSHAGSIHPRRKQEVGRRLMLSVNSVVYQATNQVIYGPVLDTAKVTATDQLSITYQEGTAVNLHAHGAAACNTVNSKLCCGESPFEVTSDGATWSRVKFSIDGDHVTLTVSNAAAVTGLRYAYENMPQCSLYAGIGAPGTGINGTEPADAPGATGVAAAPFIVNMTALVTPV